MGEFLCEICGCVFNSREYVVCPDCGADPERDDDIYSDEYDDPYEDYQENFQDLL